MIWTLERLLHIFKVHNSKVSFLGVSESCDKLECNLVPVFCVKLDFQSFLITWLLNADVSFEILDINVFVSMAALELDDLVEFVFLELVVFPSAVDDVQVIVVTKHFPAFAVENSTFFELSHQQSI